MSDKTESRWAVFAGYSDDTFGIVAAAVGVPLLDHDDCAAMSPRAFVLRATSGAELVVVGHCSGEAWKDTRSVVCPLNWMVGVAAPDSWEESDSHWPWPVRYLAGAELRDRVSMPTPYTPHLLVEMPVGTLIQLADGRSKTEGGEDETWGVVR